MSNFVKHYGIFWTSPDGKMCWARCTNRRMAQRKARAVRGVVMQVDYGSRDPWDAPTFKYCGTVIADYRVRRPS